MSRATRAKEAVADVGSRDYVGGLRAALYILAFSPVLLVSPAVRALPATWRIFHKLHAWSAWQMQKAASADALANVRHSNDKEDVLPAKWVEGDEDDKNRTGWKVKGLGGKRYDGGVRGGSSSRFGKADLIHINEDDTEQGTWAEAAIDAAFQLDRERYLFRNATVNAEYTIAPQAAGQEAIADGGVNPENWQPQSVDVSLRRPGILDDVMVPLTSRAGYDGQVISWNQYSNIKQEKTDQESIRDAKNAGWMAAKLDDIEGMDLLKWIIILGLWSAILLFHQDIGAAISGLTNSGGAVSDAAGGALGMVDLTAMVPGVN